MRAHPAADEIHTVENVGALMPGLRRDLETLVRIPSVSVPGRIDQPLLDAFGWLFAWAGPAATVRLDSRTGAKAWAAITAVAAATAAISAVLGSDTAKARTRGHNQRRPKIGPPQRTHLECSKFMAETLGAVRNAYQCRAS